MCVESESESLLSQYKFTRKFVLWCTVTNRINSRQIKTPTKAKKTLDTRHVIIIAALKSKCLYCDDIMG